MPPIKFIRLQILVALLVSSTAQAGLLIYDEAQDGEIAGQTFTLSAAGTNRIFGTAGYDSEGNNTEFPGATRFDFDDLTLRIDSDLVVSRISFSLGEIAIENLRSANAVFVAAEVIPTRNQFLQGQLNLFQNGNLTSGIASAEGAFGGDINIRAAANINRFGLDPAVRSVLTYDYLWTIQTEEIRAVPSTATFPLLLMGLFVMGMRRTRLARSVREGSGDGLASLGEQVGRTALAYASPRENAAS